MMRGLLLFLVLSGYTLQGAAQISLDTADMPDAPAQFVYSIATEGPTTPPLSKDGQGTIWDYSDMDRIGQRVDSFFRVSNTPTAYQAQFDNPFNPGYRADHAQKAPEAASDSIALPLSIEDRYDYFKKSVGGYELLGFGARINGFPTSSKYDPKDRVYPMPLQYGVTDSSYAHLTFDAIPGFYYEQERWRVDTVDGEGTLITPYDTYSSCLRVKTHLIIKDSLKSDSLGVDTATFRPEKVIHEWFASSEKVPVLRIVQRGGVVNQVEYRDTVHQTSIASHREADLRIYPNPSVSTVNVELGDRQWERLELWSLKGERLEARSISAGEGAERIDLRPYARGVYILRLEGKEGVLRRRLVRE